MAVFAYPHFLFFDGTGLALATLSIALLLDQNYRQTCRNELRAYGVKSVMIGIVFAFAHVLFFLSNQQFEDFLILSEFIHRIKAGTHADILTPEQRENLARSEHLRWCAFHYTFGYDVMEKAEFIQRVKDRQDEISKFGNSKLKTTKNEKN